MKNVEETHDFWLERRLNLAVLDPLPVDASIERVAPHVVLASRAAAQSLARVLRQEL